MTQPSNFQPRQGHRSWEDEYLPQQARDALKRGSTQKRGRPRETELTAAEKDFMLLGTPQTFSAVPTLEMLAEAEALEYARSQMSDWERYLGDPPPGYSALDFVRGTYRGQVLLCQEPSDATASPSGTLA